MKQEHLALHEQALSLSRTYKKTEADLLEILTHIEKSKVYLELGYPSLYRYCFEGLQLSEAQSYAMMSVTRKSKEVPALKEAIQSGGLSLYKAKKIVPVLKVENQQEWIEKAKTLPKAELEREVAKADPELRKREVTTRVLDEDTISLHLKISQKDLETLKRLQVCFSKKLRKSVSLVEVLSSISQEALERHDPVVRAERILKKAEKKSKVELQPESLKSPELVPGPVDRQRRPIPNRVRHQLMLATKACCQFKSEDGIACEEKHFNEIHHILPVSHGGTNELQNLTMLCSAHHRAHHG